MAGGESKRILAVASSGGHWVQLRRLRPAFEGHDVAYVTTNPGHRPEVGAARFYVVRDGNRTSKLSLLVSAVQIGRVIIRERPQVVIHLAAVGFRGAIHFDPSKPDGQPRRCLDVTRARELLGFEATTGFVEGLDRTIASYLEGAAGRA